LAKLALAATNKQIKVGLIMFSDIGAQTRSQDAALDRIVTFAQSDMFERMFREGMDLVEETAEYLDGEGRTEAKSLERAAALAYASESMRLTTRLMQSASWLLVQRAVREGEMSARDARDPKYRLGARSVCVTDTNELLALPARLTDLLERSKRLYDRVGRLETSLFEDDKVVRENPVNAQLVRLQAALSAAALEA
jgi:regulator of CtrA degradation